MVKTSDVIQVREKEIESRIELCVWVAAICIYELQALVVGMVAGKLAAMAAKAKTKKEGCHLEREQASSGTAPGHCKKEICRDGEGKTAFRLRHLRRGKRGRQN